VGAGKAAREKAPRREAVEGLGQVEVRLLVGAEKTKTFSES